MAKSIDKGDIVYWDWGEVPASGKVIELYSNVSNSANPFPFTRLSELKNALLIQLEDGRKVLKLENEVNLEDGSV
jgi:hypothetical protein